MPQMGVVPDGDGFRDEFRNHWMFVVIVVRKHGYISHGDVSGFSWISWKGVDCFLDGQESGLRSWFLNIQGANIVGWR